RWLCGAYQPPSSGRAGFHGAVGRASSRCRSAFLHLFKLGSPPAYPIHNVRAIRDGCFSEFTSSNEGGTVRPSAFAVLRLMTRSNFVGSSTGRSDGFASTARFSEDWVVADAVQAKPVSGQLGNFHEFLASRGGLRCPNSCAASTSSPIPYSS